MIDQNVFFRNAVIKICSSLEIEKSLWQCLWYMQEHIPVSQMSLHLYDRGTGVAETIAHATLEGAESLSIRTQLAERGRNQVLEQRSIRVRLVENTSQDPVAGPLCERIGCLDLSAIVMDLVLERALIGVLTLQSLPGAQFNEEHKELVAPLNEPFAVAMTNSLRYRELGTYRDMLVDDNQYLHQELRRKAGEHLVGAESGLKEVMDLVRQVAPLDSPVLLLGETGVGKELVANTIHQISPRREGPFIDVNCGAIPEPLMDSELFGHEKGAFTGAISQKRGRFERAKGGTIFLDEIGELARDAQVRLLRVLQERRIERLGGMEHISLDIRVLAATHRSLGRMIQEGNFREDLFFRLKVFPITIPPLRKRKADIPDLVRHFMEKKSTEMKLRRRPKIVPNAIDRLMAHDWPGNVRELENAVERAIILSQGNPITFKEFSLSETTERTVEENLTASSDPGEAESLSLDEVNAAHIRRVLAMTKGKIDGPKGAAELLQINSRTLRHRMRKLGVPFGNRAKDLYG